MAIDEEDARSCREEIESELRDVDFSTFVLSLGTSALYHLGIKDPNTDQVDGFEPNLSLARNVIDIISMLKEKTRGNLTDDESRLVETLLFDLRLKFVDVCKAQPPSSGA